MHTCICYMCIKYKVFRNRLCVCARGLPRSEAAGRHVDVPAAWPAWPGLAPLGLKRASTSSAKM